MAQGYTRNDTTNNIADGNIINASDLDGEFDAVQAAFDATTGHTHDGTVGGGAPIEVLGPSQNVVVSAAVVRPKDDNTIDLGTSALEFKNLYLDGTAQVDTLQVDESATITANLNVSGNTTLGNAATKTVTFVAEVASNLVPSADNTYDLGTTTDEWRNIYIDGTAQVDTLQVDESATVTANLTVNGNTTLGNASTDTLTLAAQVASSVVPSMDDTSDLGSTTNEWRNLYVDGTANIDSLVADTVDINGGTIDNATIATSNITVGAGKTLDVSAGTFTVANDQISGDKVEGGTINAITINNLTSTNANVTTVDATNLEVTNIKAKDGTASATIADTTGVMTIGSSVLTTSDINGGTIDGTVIGGASAAAGTFTTATATTGNITTVNATTVDTTNLEVTNIKAKDGTSAGSIAGTTGVVTLASSVLSTTDINGGTIDGTVIGGTTPAAISGTTGTFSGNVTLGPVHYGGTLSVSSAAVGGETTLVVSNSSTNQFARLGINGDVAQIAWDDGDALALGIANNSSVAGLTTEYMRILSNGNVGIGTNTPTTKLDVNGSVKVTGTISGTAVTQSAIDTTAGRLMKVGDFGIGTAGAPATVVNLDDGTLASGSYITHPINTNAGTWPTGMAAGFAVLHVQRISAVALVESLTPLEVSKGVWIRSFNSGVWTAWARAVNDERGSNANGEYVRFADGTQICTRALTASSSAGVTWTFPAAFVAAPVVNGNAVATVLSAVCLDAAPSATAVTLSVRDKADARRADVMQLMAVGRWF